MNNLNTQFPIYDFNMSDLTVDVTQQFKIINNIYEEKAKTIF